MNYQKDISKPFDIATSPGVPNEFGTVDRHPDIEARLLSEREDFRNSFDVMPFGIQIINSAGKLVYLNHTILEMWGYENLEQLKKIRLEQAFTPGSVVLVRNLFGQRNSGKLPPVHEVTIIRKNGQLHDLRVHGGEIYWRGEKCVQLIYEDITVNKRMEKSIHDLHDTLELIRNINRLIVREDNELELLQKGCDQIVKDNRYQLAWIGFSKESNNGIPLMVMAGRGVDYIKADRIGQADLPVQSPVHISLMSGKPCVVSDISSDPRFQPWREEAENKGFRSMVVLPLKTQDRISGNLNIYSETLNAFNPEEVELLAELAADLSIGVEKIRRRQEHNKTEQALADEAVRRRILIEQSSDGIVVLDQKGKVFEANKRFAEMLGYSPDEVLQLHVWDWDTRTPREFFTPIPAEIAGPRFETKHYRKDGSAYDVEICSNEAIIAGQKLVFCVCRDITERKQMQEKLVITDRLASIGELSAGIAHELNNPLTSVIGLSDMLLEENLTDETRKDVELMSKEANRMADVVKNMLVFARRHPTVKQQMDINSIIIKTLEMRIYEHKLTNIQVIKRFAAGLPEIEVDYFQLQQVFMNIITNAEYFLKEANRGGVITITTENNGNNIRISFADNGPGIPEENLDHVFDPFFTTKPIGKGTGLGLSICHGIVTAHNGRIYVESQLGKGTTFIIELPIQNN